MIFRKIASKMAVWVAWDKASNEVTKLEAVKRILQKRWTLIGTFHDAYKTYVHKYIYIYTYSCRRVVGFGTH